MRPLPIAAATALLALTQIAGASAASPAAWHPSIPILTGEIVGMPAAAITKGGGTLVALGRKDGLSYVVEAISRPLPRGAYTTPTTVSARAPRPFGPVAAAITARGDAVVAWITPGGAVQATRRTGYLGAWRRVALSGVGARSVRVAIRPDGRSTVLWTRYDGAWHVAGAAATDMASPFAPAPALDAETAHEPVIALDASGAGAAAWLSDADARVRGSRLLPGPAGAWDLPADLSAAGAFDPDVAVDPAGGASVVWTLGPLPSAVQGAVRDPLAAAWWPVAISLSGRFPHVARGVSGQTVVEWADLIRSGSRLAVQASTIASLSTTPGPTVTVYDDFPFTDAILRLQEARIVARGTDGALLAFADPEGAGSETLYGAVLASGAWQAPQPLISYERTHIPGVAATEAGEGLVVAARTGELPDLRAAVYDTRPPVRLAPTVVGPASARLGGRVTWTFRIHNSGAVPAYEVIVRHDLPTGMSFVSARPRARIGARLSRVWKLGMITAGATKTIRLVTTSGTRTGPRISSILVSAREIEGIVVSGTTVIRR